MMVAKVRRSDPDEVRSSVSRAETQARLNGPSGGPTSLLRRVLLTGLAGAILFAVVFVGRAEAEFYYGSSANEIYAGTSAGDVVRLYGGQDEARGLAGNDVLFGGRGHDLLVGGEGSDGLYGGRGNDRLRAYGQGRDDVIGGPGFDICTVGPLDYVEGCELVRYGP